MIVAYPITFDGNPDSYPLHLARRRSFPTATAPASTSRSSTRNRSRFPRLEAAISSRSPICSLPWLWSRQGIRPMKWRRRSMAEFDKLRTEPISERELQRAKNQFFRDYIVDRESDPRQGQPARSRRRHPSGRDDRRRRSRNFHEHEGGRYRPGRQDVLQTGEPPHSEDSAESGGEPLMRAARACRFHSRAPDRIVGTHAARRSRHGRRKVLPGRCRRDPSAFRPTSSDPCPTACR